MRILKAGGLYFALVFGAGFVLGPIRLLWLVPRFGTRTAELMEMRWIIRRLAVPSAPSSRLGMGFLALGLLVAAEFGFVLRLRGLSINAYFADRDPVSGAVYCLMLAVYAIMPLLVLRR